MIDPPTWVLSILARFTVVGPLRERLALTEMKLSTSEALIGEYYRDNQQLKIDISERDKKIKDLENSLNHCNAKLDEATRYKPSDLEPDPTVD